MKNKQRWKVRDYVEPLENKIVVSVLMYFLISEIDDDYDNHGEFGNMVAHHIKKTFAFDESTFSYCEDGYVIVQTNFDLITVLNSDMSPTNLAQCLITQLEKNFMYDISFSQIVIHQEIFDEIGF